MRGNATSFSRTSFSTTEYNHEKHSASVKTKYDVPQFVVLHLPTLTVFSCTPPPPLFLRPAEKSHLYSNSHVIKFKFYVGSNSHSHMIM